MGKDVHPDDSVMLAVKTLLDATKGAGMEAWSGTEYKPYNGRIYTIRVSSRKATKDEMARCK